MKSIIVALLGTALVGGIWFISAKDFTQVYQAEVVEKIIDNTPEWAEDADAVAAAKAVIRKKELEAELEVLNLEIEERKDRATEIEKELGSY